MRAYDYHEDGWKLYYEHYKESLCGRRCKVIRGKHEGMEGVIVDLEITIAPECTYIVYVPYPCTLTLLTDSQEQKKVCVSGIIDGKLYAVEGFVEFIDTI